MLTNIIDEKANDPAHNAPLSCAKKMAPDRPEPRKDYPLKRAREKGVRSNCGSTP